ncbi:MAG TPA: nucleotidyltransferase domain-containing protein [Spirochaetota bacterium]|nr:nucleotidyltransferase domain-containing protein [Spirochaetota bacterium]
MESKIVSNIEILNEIKSIIQEKYPDIISKIILFGSRNSGNAGLYSDYDILIILNKEFDSTIEIDIIDLCYEADLKYDIVTDIKIISINDLDLPRGKQRYIRTALMEGLAV